MTHSIAPAYAGLLTLFFVLLSFRVIAQRRSSRVALGDGGDSVLIRRQRVHGNFAEYVPLAILLLALAEFQGVSAWTLHVIGASLVLGRLFHAYGVGREPETVGLRVTGMTFTFISLITGALANLGVGGPISVMLG